MDNCGLTEKITELKNKMSEENYQRTQTPVKPKLGQGIAQEQTAQATPEVAPVSPENNQNV